MSSLVIYGRPGCPYCEKAKKLASMLEEQGYFRDVQYINYQELGWTAEELSKVANHPIRTVPVILMGAKGSEVFIGGYTDLHDRYPID